MVLPTLVAAACVPGGPIYVGPPAVKLEGQVYVVEEQRPLPNAEVCAFGADTVCVATDTQGHFRVEFRSTILLQGGALTLRFRTSGLPPAVAELHNVTPGEMTRVDCGISNRLTLSTEPATCLSSRT
jgi:hypothetical protein